MTIANPLPVIIKPTKLNYLGANIIYPQVVDFPNRIVQQSINQTILQLVISLINKQSEEQGVPIFEEMIGTFEIKNNQQDILSLTLSNYAYAHHHAHGLTIMKSLTFDTQTGKVYSLSELFKHGSNYIDVLSALVQEQIKTRHIDLLNPFPGVSPTQDFYIADKTLVLYYQLYDITPYYFGFPIFPISVYEIDNIINENGPLGRMATNT